MWAASSFKALLRSFTTFLPFSFSILSWPIRSMPFWVFLYPSCLSEIFFFLISLILAFLTVFKILPYCHHSLYGRHCSKSTFLDVSCRFCPRLWNLRSFFEPLFLFLPPFGPCFDGLKRKIKGETKNKAKACYDLKSCPWKQNHHQICLTLTKKVHQNLQNVCQIDSSFYSTYFQIPYGNLRRNRLERMCWQCFLAGSFSAHWKVLFGLLNVDYNERACVFFNFFLFFFNVCFWFAERRS